MCDISLSVLLMGNSGPGSQETVPADSPETTRSLLLTSRGPAVPPPRTPLRLAQIEICASAPRPEKPFAFLCQVSPYGDIWSSGRSGSWRYGERRRRLMYSFAPLISTIRWLVKWRAKKSPFQLICRVTLGVLLSLPRHLMLWHSSLISANHILISRYM